MSLSRGQRLLRLREQAGVEQKDAAAAIGISRPYLSLLERDLKGRNVDHLRGTFERAASYYGVIPEYLLAETPQEYMKVWLGRVEGPPTFGQRLSIVLHELQLRWGEGFSQTAVANSIGTTGEALNDYLDDRVQVTTSVAHQLSVATGAPVEWLVPRPTSKSGRDPGIQRVIEMAVASGMQTGELEALIRVWLAAKNQQPSGR